MPDLDIIKEISWNQLGAAIDMLQDVVEAAPDDLWGNDLEAGSFWQTAFHTIFWLDFYSSETRAAYSPPAPIGLEELTYGSKPPRVYSKVELLAFLDHARANAHESIMRLTAETALEPSDTRKGMPRLELAFYTMRHTQHHTGQLVRMLRNSAGVGSKWVGRVRG